MIRLMGGPPLGMNPGYFSYFQLRDLPWASHSSAVAMRFSRVGCGLASVIHSTYSRLWLGLNCWNVASAFLLFPSAAAKSFGTTTARGRVGRGARGTFTPSSLSFAAFLM